MKLLVVEDNIKIAALIEKGMREAGFHVDVCHDGRSGLAAARTGEYDAAVVDIMLPELDGLQLIERLRLQKINTPIIILSAKQSVDDRIRGLQLGGDDYMVKPFSFSELLARVEALIRRERNRAEPTTLSYDELRMNMLTREVYRRGQKIELPAKEYALLELLMRSPEMVVSKTSILERVYEYAFDPQTNIVDVLVCRLRTNVDRDYEHKLIHTIRGRGYVLKAGG
jgi:two-component system OmpR family response regulator